MQLVPLSLCLLSLLLFRLGRWASSTLAFWVLELWENEQEAKPEDRMSGRRNVSQLSATAFVSSTGLWQI